MSEDYSELTFKHLNEDNTQECLHVAEEEM